MPGDVIDVQYHTNSPAPDKINEESPVISSNRGLFYGNTRVPYAVLDGGPYDELLEADRTYDFSPRIPNVEDVHSRSLTAPDFDLRIQVNHVAPSLDLEVKIKALETMPAGELTLYTIVVQDTIDDPYYKESEDQPDFRNVARKLLPNTGGVPNTKWDVGADDTIRVPLTWDPIPGWMDLDRLSIVAFIQDDNTKEILQAATTQEFNSETGTWSGSILEDMNILLYPNPAGEYINVFFEDRPTEDLELRIYNMSGRMVLHDRVGEGELTHTVELSSMPDGLYIIELRKARNGAFYFRNKFFHY